MGDKSLDLRHHPVLAVISNCYSEPKGRFPRVTHPCATKAEAFVRLACVRHAASVRSEPESNSQVEDRQARRNRPGRPTSLGAVPAQIYKLVCLRMRTIGTALNLTDHPKPRGPGRPGRRPHVPSSNRQCQRADALSPPVRWFRASVFRLGEARCRGGPKWPPPLL